MQTKRHYLICTTPRTGSWLLCTTLSALPGAGTPAEFFHAELLKSQPREPVRRRLQLEVRRSQSKTTGIFGGKIHWSQHALATRLLAAEPEEPAMTLPRMFTEELPGLRYIYLYRKDKVRQAVSYYRALETGQWWRIRDEQAGEPDCVEHFDFDSLQRLERMLTRQDECWRRHFEAFGIDPLILSYEDIETDPTAAAAELLHHVGLPAPACSPEPELVRQADQKSQLWVECYRSRQAAELGVHPSLGESPRLQQPVVNRREFRVVAPQRSGHHGVINWLGGQSVDGALFLNDSAPDTNPFMTATVLSRFESGVNERLERKHIHTNTPRDCLIYNYEDRPLVSVFTDFFETNHDGWLGNSERRNDIIVLRDPFNTFASRMTARWVRHQVGDEADRAAAVELWKSYAREAIGETHLARQRRLIVLFNRWATDENYRRDLAGKLDLSFSDAGFKKVSAEYGGSSFDGVRYDGHADKMALLERWKRYEGDPMFESIFQDRELTQLSEAIFGPIPGTERLIARVNSTSPLKGAWPANDTIRLNGASRGNGMSRADGVLAPANSALSGSTRNQ
jgi:LPS sulfotransferase NodH